MSLGTAEEILKTRLAERTGTNTDDWFLVVKARFGLEIIFKALADMRGSGEVITSPYTCLTAVNPILSAGHTPVYGDISSSNLSLDPSTILPTPAARAVVVQHSFGIPADMVVARQFANAHNLLLVEDSAHKLGLMGSSDGMPLADVSVHSFGVEKMLPTKFGAAVWLNPKLRDGALGDTLRETFSALPKLSPLRNLRMRTYKFSNGVLNRLPAFMNSSRVSDALASAGLFETAIAPVERHGQNSGTSARPSLWMLQRILKAFEIYDTNLAERQAATQHYFKAFTDTDDFTILAGITPDGSYTRFPVVCHSTDQATKLFATLSAQGLHPGRWYRPTLFPGPSDSSLYHYDQSACPVAEDISARILNLPTNISLKKVEEVTRACHR